MLKVLLAVLFIQTFASAQQVPTPAAEAWWTLTTALANDGMQGRDTGSEAYERAAEFVAARFRNAGLQPGGDHGTFFQSVPMHQISLLTGSSSLDILHPQGEDITLNFTTEVTTSPQGNFSIDAAPLVFVGYGLPDRPLDLEGKIAVFFNNVPAGLSEQDRATFPARRLRLLAQAGAVAMISVDNPASIEPFHWPAAYARTVTLIDQPSPASARPPLIRLNPAYLDAILRADTAPEHTASRLLEDGGKGAPLPAFAIGLAARIHLKVVEQDIASPNVLAILPGADPALKGEYVAVSAHLDGYGFGTPVQGDNLYNGALDDAAYVATLLELAEDLAKTPPKRSILFCIFTGEEKGLLGSDYFTHHLTVPAKSIVADLNLDQLRPIFPLNILTMEGIADSTLGETARQVATDFHIALRPDLEPERNLFRRADNYSFVRIGVPVASFIFGYNPGSPEERIYRDWYARRYHKPQDDLSTPIDWDAAVKFNRFYRALTLAVADAPARPAWSPVSPNAPRP